MYKKHLARITSLTLWILLAACVPQYAHGQTIRDFIETAQGIVATAIAPLLALIVVSFFIGVIQFLRASSNNPQAAIKGRSVLLWGVLVLFVVVSVWGIIRVVRTTFGL